VDEETNTPASSGLTRAYPKVLSIARDAPEVACRVAEPQGSRMVVASLAKTAEERVPCVTIFEMLVKGSGAVGGRG
jgi:hypothetical protein